MHREIGDYYAAGMDEAATERKGIAPLKPSVVREYGGFSPVPGLNLKGRPTTGENAADNGGLGLAYMALMDRLAGHPLEKVDGYTPRQQFFLGFAQVFCAQQTEEASRVLARTDPHSPGMFRVNGTPQNMPEFSAAWSCKTACAMVAPDPCRVR